MGGLMAPRALCATLCATEGCRGWCARARIQGGAGRGAPHPTCSTVLFPTRKVKWLVSNPAAGRPISA